MLGNAAIAQGAYEAGVKVSAAYPGTPSTEISECIVKYPEVYAEWSPNEKVAMEVAIGASIAGVRAMASMKLVGVNVAADPLYCLQNWRLNTAKSMIPRSSCAQLPVCLTRRALCIRKNGWRFRISHMKRTLKKMC